MKISRLIAPLGGLAALLVGGCSTLGRIVREPGASTAEATLAAAGFHIEPADTADRIAELDAMPPFAVIGQLRDGKQLYTYADPLKCHCEYVGDPQQYEQYKRLPE